jgi:hypothetical protein
LDRDQVLDMADALAQVGVGDDLDDRLAELIH